MRVRLDPETCQGHGRCYVLAPEVFDSDDYGHCVVLLEDVPAGHESQAKDAVENCPERALTLES